MECQGLLASLRSELEAALVGEKQQEKAVLEGWKAASAIRPRENRKNESTVEKAERGKEMRLSRGDRPRSSPL